MKTAAFLMALLVPSLAFAGDYGKFGFSVHAKATHSKKVAEEHKIKSELGIRLITDFAKGKQTLYFIPRVGYEYGKWNLGPELRMPITKDAPWKLLLKLELKLPEF